jgi:hypothetical protein
MENARDFKRVPSLIRALGAGPAETGSMSLQSVTAKIDSILWIAVMVICAGVWVFSGFPHLKEVVGFGGLMAVCGILWWLVSRRGEKT